MFKTCVGTWTDEMNRECALKTGLYYQIDSIYSDGVNTLCTSACKCNANATQWPQSQSVFMITDKMGSSGLLDCPMQDLTSY